MKDSFYLYSSLYLINLKLPLAMSCDDAAAT